MNLPIQAPLVRADISSDHQTGPFFPERAGETGQIYLRAIFALVAVLAPVCMYFGVRGFAPSLALVGFLCLPLARPSRTDLIGGGLLLALVIWAAISLNWSPAPAFNGFVKAKDFQRFTALHLGLQLVLSGAFVLGMRRATAETAKRGVTWIGYGLLVGAAALTAEMFTHAAVYRALAKAIGKPVRPDLAIRNLAQAGDVVAMLAWPAGMALIRRGWRGGAFALGAFVPLSFIMFRGFAPSLALFISIGVFAWMRRSGRKALYTLMALAIGDILLTPWILLGLQRSGVFAALQAHLPPSWAARLEIWRIVSSRLMDHPLLGSGLDASRMLHGDILHPHDVPLQIWFELGAPGACLAAAFWASLFARLAYQADKDRLFVSTAAATATVYLVIGVVGFSLWQEWWLCVGALSLGLCIAIGKFSKNTGWALPSIG